MTFKCEMFILPGTIIGVVISISLEYLHVVIKTAVFVGCIM